MARKGHPEDESAIRPRALLVRADDGDAEDGPVGGANEPLDSRLLDMEEEQESPFLRSQKRVPVRRGPLPKKTAYRLKYSCIGLAAVAMVAVAIWAVAHYGRNSWRFRLDSSDNIQVTGNQNVSRSEIVRVFDGDISKNMFFISLEERKRKLEEIPWVESATVMRLLPNRLKVEVKERVPIAYAQVGTQIKFIDAGGVLMDPRQGNTYSFPVVVGFGGIEPLSTRAARMKIYQTMVHDLDADSANYSRDLDEVDLSDPDDVRIMVKDPQGEVLIHLGPSKEVQDFLRRYKVYLSEVQGFRQRFQRLGSVDLRYLPQIVVNPGTASQTVAPPATEAAVNPPAMASPAAGPSKSAAPNGGKGKPSASHLRKNR